MKAGTVGQAVMVVALIGLLVAGIAMCSGYVKTVRFMREYKRVEELYPVFENARPTDVPADLWERMWGMTQTGIMNVCYSPEHVDLEALRAFRKSLEKKAQGPMSTDMLLSIWNELEELEATGRHGQDYAVRYREVFLMIREGRD